MTRLHLLHRRPTTAKIREQHSIDICISSEQLFRPASGKSGPPIGNPAITEYAGLEDQEDLPCGSDWFCFQDRYRVTILYPIRANQEEPPHRAWGEMEIGVVVIDPDSRRSTGHIEKVTPPKNNGPKSTIRAPAQHPVRGVRQREPNLPVRWDGDRRRREAEPSRSGPSPSWFESNG